MSILWLGLRGYIRGVADDALNPNIDMTGDPAATPQHYSVATLCSQPSEANPSDLPLSNARPVLGLRAGCGLGIGAGLLVFSETDVVRNCDNADDTPDDNGDGGVQNEDIVSVAAGVSP